MQKPISKEEANPSMTTSTSTDMVIDNFAPKNKQLKDFKEQLQEIDREINVIDIIKDSAKNFTVRGEFNYPDFSKHWSPHRYELPGGIHHLYL